MQFVRYLTNHTRYRLRSNASVCKISQQCGNHFQRNAKPRVEIHIILVGILTRVTFSSRSCSCSQIGLTFREGETKRSNELNLVRFLTDEKGKRKKYSSHVRLAHRLKKTTERVISLNWSTNRYGRNEEATLGLFFNAE